MRKCAVIAEVMPDSIAEELGLKPGDVVRAVNGKEIADFLDYQFLTASQDILLTVQKEEGDLIEFEIENEELEDLGITFASYLFDEAKSCSNRCIFCFIDQLPPGMRKSLYFKDDDSRLSFLYGNYVTMTNMLPKDVQRLVDYHVSPVNISVHTTNPELRKEMLQNKHAGRLLEYMQMLSDGGITMNMQIVLCKGVNDGNELDKTLADLAAFHPAAASVSIVPVGLTRYREGLYPLEPFGKEDALQVVRQVEAYQEKYLQELGTRFVYLSDEFYLLSGLPLPPFSAYEDFPQIENAVGMEVSFLEEFMSALEEEPALSYQGKTLVATGVLALPFIQDLLGRAVERYPALQLEAVGIRNDLFGEGVTVAGLIGGRDLISQTRGLSCDRLLIPSSMLKADEDIFLDDVTLCEVEEALGVPVIPVFNDGAVFLHHLLHEGQYKFG